MPVSRIKPEGDYGCIITNPPYGLRLGDETEAEKAVSQLGLSMLYLPTWSMFALTQSKTFEQTIGRKRTSGANCSMAGSNVRSINSSGRCLRATRADEHPGAFPQAAPTSGAVSLCSPAAAA